MSDSIKQVMKSAVRAILKDEYDLLEDFFDVIRQDEADYIIYISRRCFVLYQLIAYINGWRRNNVISDRGVWAYRKRIRCARRIVIADDVLVWGVAMREAYELLNNMLGLSEKCEVKRVIYCRYAGCNKDDVAGVHVFSTRSMRECRILTNKLVKSIMVSGIPYTSFLYSFYGKDLGMKPPSGDKVLRFEPVKATEFKWKSLYDFGIHENLQSMLECLCDGACIRYYYEEKKGYLCVIPFAFISDIQNQYLATYYQNIAECCRESGWLEIADEINAAVTDENDEKWQYLAMLQSSLLSCVIGVTEHIGQKFMEQYDREISRRSLEGIFSEGIFRCLEQVNEESCLRFAKQVRLKRDVWDACVLRLPEAEGNGDKKQCLEEMLAQFSKMRSKYEISHDPGDKQIYCRELYEEYLKKYRRDVIQAAQIECYDAGVVTYGFLHDQAVGSVSKCGIGEGSSILFPLKYRDIIHKYYIVNSREETKNGALDAARRKANLDMVLEEEELPGPEKELFWSFIQGDINNIYDYYLNE